MVVCSATSGAAVEVFVLSQLIFCGLLNVGFLHLRQPAEVVLASAKKVFCLCSVVEDSLEQIASLQICRESQCWDPSFHAAIRFPFLFFLH